MKFKRQPADAILQTHYSNEQPHGLATGIVSTFLATGSILGVGLTFACMLPCDDVDLEYESLLAVRFLFLPGAGILAVVATLLAGMAVMQLEKKEIRVCFLTRIAAGLGILGVGLVVGLSLARWVKLNQFTPKGIEYDNNLSVTGYTIIGVMLGILVVGLGWCFHRAMKASSQKSEEQAAEI